MYRWHIIVVKYNVYGDKRVQETPVTIFAPTREDVTGKVREAFNATYDDFRKFWSHDWVLVSMDEVDE